MIISFLDTLLLSDNKEYVVTGIVNYNNIDYYCLVEKNDAKNVKFCYQKEEKLVEINDPEIIRKIINLYYEEMKKNISNE